MAKRVKKAVEAAPEANYAGDMFSSRPQVDQKFYIFTNRNNLNSILSTGNILPKSLSAKYYGDAGSLVEDGIVLFDGGINESISNALGITGTNFPVLLEVPGSRLSGIGYSVKSGGTLERVQLPPSEGDLLVVFHAIPTSLVQWFHFRSEDELMEYKVREFGNVPPLHDDKIGISPELFSYDRAFQLSNLPSIPAPSRIPKEGLKSRYNLLDRITGSLLLVGVQVSIDLDVPIAIVQSQLQVLLRGLSDIESADTGNIFQPANGFFQSLAGDSPISTDNFETANLSEYDRTEMRLFSTILTQITTIRHDEFVASVFLSDVRREFLHGTDAGDRRNQSYERTFDRMQQVLNYEIDIDEFFNFLDTDTQVTIALLCFLLRPDPENVLTWREERTPPPWKQRTIAAIFAGALYGFAAMPTRLRYRINGRLPGFLAFQTARYLNAGAGSFQLSQPVNNEIVAGYSEDGQEQLSGWNQILVSRASEFDFGSAIQAWLFVDPNATDLLEDAIALCEEMKWTDAIRSTIRFGDRHFTLQFDGAEHVLDLSGKVNLEHRIETDIFRSHLRETPLQQIQQRAGVATVRRFVLRGQQLPEPGKRTVGKRK
jgi:hypothetical protein